MIKSEKGHIDIEGRNIDLVVEWAILYREMIKNHPVMVAETCIAFEQELHNADVNVLEAAIVQSIVQTVKGAHGDE